jgi:hypothetical protein
MVPSNPGDSTPWTPETLYHYFSRVLEEMDKRISGRFDLTEQHARDQRETLNDAILSVEKAANAAMLASEKAINKADVASEKRFDSVNEFRAAMSDQARMLITRAEVDQRLLGSDKETAGIVSRLDRIEAKGLGLQAGWGILISIITVAGLVIFGVLMALKH